MLMQDQLCHADADIITYNWIDTQPYPFPDFSLNRKCRDVDQVLRWRDEHHVDIDKYHAWPKPEGARTLPFEKGYYEMYGFDASELFPNGAGYGEVDQ
ncbi:hypothetical protein MMC27_003569 [Xylographa pallens]|nr:hypothetical protein [Xylographa pallens]